DVVAFDDLGKLGVLGKEAVTRMDRVGVDDLGGRNDVGDVEVGFGSRRRADAHGLVGEPDVHRIGICGGMDRDGLDAHLVAGAMRASSWPRVGGALGAGAAAARAGAAALIMAGASRLTLIRRSPSATSISVK